MTSLVFRLAIGAGMLAMAAVAHGATPSTFPSAWEDLAPPAEVLLPVPPPPPRVDRAPVRLNLVIREQGRPTCSGSTARSPANAGRTPGAPVALTSRSTATRPAASPLG